MTEVAVSPPTAKPRRRGISRKKLFRRSLITKCEREHCLTFTDL